MAGETLMKTCDGCGYAFASTAEIFGGIGQGEFCFDCYAEELKLMRSREQKMRELASVQSSMIQYWCEYDDMRRKRKKYSYLRGLYEYCKMSADDIKEELDCLTVAYQRKHSVIGRVAA